MTRCLRAHHRPDSPGYRELLDIFIAELTSTFTVEEFYREGQRRHLAVTPLSTAHGIVGTIILTSGTFFHKIAGPGESGLRYPGPRPSLFADTLGYAPSSAQSRSA